MRPKLLWGRLRAKLLSGEARWAAAQVTGGPAEGQEVAKCVVWVGMRANLLRCRVGCGPGFGTICRVGGGSDSKPTQGFCVHTSPNMDILVHFGSCLND